MGSDFELLPRFCLEALALQARRDCFPVELDVLCCQLERNDLQVVFSVNPFNEGVDLPSIDTIMMLRPTESKILFLQQLGRGLRLAEPEKTHVVILDFIGNHHSFLHKPQALLGEAMNYRALADFADRASNDELELPPGCFVNYQLELIDFLKSLQSDGPEKDYMALRESLGRRPTLTEFYRSGAGADKAAPFHYYGEVRYRSHEGTKPMSVVWTLA